MKWKYINHLKENKSYSIKKQICKIKFYINVFNFICDNDALL